MRLLDHAEHHMGAATIGCRPHVALACDEFSDSPRWWCSSLHLASPGRRSLHLDLRRPAGGLLVQAPGADGDGRVGLRGRHLALAVDAELLAHGAAEDPIDDGRLDVREAAAAELLELGRVEALVHLVDAAALAEEVHDPEGLVHDLALLEEVRFPLGRAHAPAELPTAQRRGPGPSC